MSALPDRVVAWAKAAWPVDEPWDPKLETILRYCASTADATNPMGGFSNIRGVTAVLDATFIRAAVGQYRAARSARVTLKPVNTAVDRAVEELAVSSGQVAPTDVDLASGLHRLMMQCENVLGTMLEMYIASVLEPLGWVWCSGAFVRAVDFLYCNSSGRYSVLQVKNSDNSENSSSSSIRTGTQIKKWARRRSLTGATMWDGLNEKVLEVCGVWPGMSEEGFLTYIRANPPTAL